jgi:hypothetical protein
MLLRERWGTQFNNCFIPDRLLDFLQTGFRSTSFFWHVPVSGSFTWIKCLNSCLRVIWLDAEPPQTQQNFIGSFPRFFFLSLSRHVWANDHMKDCSRVIFPAMLDMAPYAFHTKKLLPFSIGCRDFSPGNPENDWSHYMTFLRIFGRRIRLNNSEVEAVEELAALQDSFPETEGPSQLPLSWSAWHPIKQIVQQTFS